MTRSWKLDLVRLSTFLNPVLAEVLCFSNDLVSWTADEAVETICVHCWLLHCFASPRRSHHMCWTLLDNQVLQPFGTNQTNLAGNIPKRVKEVRSGGRRAKTFSPEPQDCGWEDLSGWAHVSRNLHQSDGKEKGTCRIGNKTQSDEFTRCFCGKNRQSQNRRLASKAWKLHATAHCQSARGKLSSWQCLVAISFTFLHVDKVQFFRTIIVLAKS